MPEEKKYTDVRVKLDFTIRLAGDRPLPGWSWVRLIALGLDRWVDLKGPGYEKIGEWEILEGGTVKVSLVQPKKGRRA